MRFKRAIALTVSVLLSFMNMSNIVMAEELQPITNGIQKINANKLEWTPVSRANQLGGADDFSGILFNELKNFNETGGPIAAGTFNNVGIVTFSEGLTGGINQFSDIVIPKFNVGIIAQRAVNKTSGRTVINNGDVVIGNSVDTEKLDPKVGNIFKRQSEIDKFLGDAKADLVKLNKDLWSTEETGIAIDDGYTVTLNCVKGINIFEVDVTSGRRNIKFTYPGDAKDSTIIIKYKGNTINYGETFIGETMLDKLNIDEISNRVIWTFDPSITDVRIDRTIVFGSILAPNANLTFSSAGYSAINGTIIANSLDGSGSSSEIHWVGPFKGDIITPIEKTGAFKFNKKDNHGNAISGATFALFQDGVEKYTVTSADTVSFSGIKPGTYILKETSAPTGYEISKSEVEVTVSNNGIVTLKENGVIKTESNLDLIYVNNISKVDFNFDKVVAGTKTGIPDVEFKLLQGDKVISTSVSDANGVVSFKNIELGSYTLVETTPLGYQSAGPWTIDITKEGAFIGEIKLDKIENAEITGAFQFDKLDNHEKAVKGAVFGLFQDGVEKYTATSTDGGLVSFNNIKKGIYTLKEISAPNGYELSGEVIEVTVNNDGKVTFKVDGKDETLADLNGVFVNKVSTADFSFNKVISGTDTGISGVEFKLMQGDKEIATSVSDAKGVVSFKNVELGKYTLIETRPFGYQSAGPWEINVTKEGTFIGETKLNQIENIEVLGTFQFNKLDNHGKAIREAKFTLSQDGVEKYTATSIDGGLVSFNNIKEGTYTLKETSAPNGYEISKTIVEVTVDKDGKVTFKVDGEAKNLSDLDVLYVNNISTVNFSFNKVIAGTKTGIPNVEFKLLQGDKTVGTAFSDEKGVVTFKGIELGKYTLVETTPTGYKAAGPWTIDVTQNGAILDGKNLVQIENVEVIGEFKFNKLDNHGNPVKGAEFALYQDGEVKYTATSTGNLSLKDFSILYQLISGSTTKASKGEVSFSGIKQGTYILKETKAPNGYEISKVEIEVTVNSDGTVTFKENGVVKTAEDLDTLYVNNVSKVAFSFNKVIYGTTKGIPNVEFKLLQDDKLVATTVSDENGTVTFEGIELGRYTLVETRPFGYQEAGPWTIDVTKEGAFINNTKLIQIANSEVSGAFQFDKLDNHERVVKGADFALFQDGVEKYKTTSTDAGLVSFSKIKEGTYILKETNAPNGYEISKAVIEVTVDKDGKVTFNVDGVVKTVAELAGLYVNNISKVDFSFNKVIVGTDIGIPNVEFTLMQGENVIATSVSDASGVVTFSGIELGTYTLVETRPFGYRGVEPWTVNVTKEGTFIGETKLDKVENAEVIGGFEFNKLDNHEKAVKGAEFGLFQDGVEKYNTTSTDAGLLSFDNIKEGTYTLKETSAPNGYEISNSVVEVTVDKDGKVSFKVFGEDKALENLNGVFINNVSKVDFNFNKVISGTDTGIPDVGFKLMQDDKEVATAVSDENGVVSFKNIELGSYQLVETRPFGYQAAGPWTVNVTKEGAFIDGTKLDKIENAEVIGGFEFIKLDNHEKAVKEAKFGLFQEGVEKYSATSIDTGLVSFNDIKEGTYTLKETSAPNGYEISNAVVEVTVDSNGNVTFKVDGEDKYLENLNGVFINNVSKEDFNFNKVISGTDIGIPDVGFKLMQDDKEVATAVSDENGVVSFKNIELGSYNLVETRPFGYQAAGPWTVNVTKEGTFIGEAKIDKIENTQVIGSFEFIKLDNHEKAVKGAVFALFQDGVEKYTATSIDTGLVSFNNIKEGTYTLNETSAPSGYEISKVIVKVTVANDGSVTFKIDGEDKALENLNGVFINNISKVDFSFYKAIYGTDAGIAGVEFKLTQGNKEVAAAVSDEDGIVSFKNIELGTYTLVETRPFGYQAAGPWTINITKEGAFIEGTKLVQIDNVEVIGAFQFDKLDNHKKAVKGATFALFQDGVELYNATSIDTGLVSFNDIKEGTYTLKETSAPAGYEISNAVVVVIVDKEGKVTFKVDGEDKPLENLNGIFINNVSRTDLNFNKVISGTDTGIPNVEFKLLKGEDVIATSVSDTSGVVTFSGIELGSYKLVETRPFGYQAVGPWTVNVTKEGAFIGEAKLDKIENTQVIGSFEFIKLDNHEKAVKGAEFALFQDGVEKYAATSTDKGLVSFNDIKEGTYTLKETSAPAGYEISEEVIEVTVNNDGKVSFKVYHEDETLADLSGVFINNVSTADFSFNKVISGTDTGIPNVEFKLMQGDKEIATSISDASGVVTFSGIELGSYTLVETRPFGYQAVGPWTVNVTKEGAFIDGTKLDKIENNQVIGAFEFIKLDNHEKAVKGAEFALYQGDTVKYTATSSEVGLVSFSDIKEGTYTLKETSAPNGYEISNAVVEVTVDSDGNVTFKIYGEDKALENLNGVFINNVSKADFNFNKVISGTDTGIYNVEFKLLQGNKEIATAVSDASGVVTFNGIELGSYTLVETRPFGYEVAGPWTVNVTKEGVFIGEAKLDKIENVEVIGAFQFDKLDNHGNAVNGAKFALLQDEVEKYSATSTDAGLVSFNNIKEGTYTLKETSAPSGYEISKSEVEVTVKSDGTITFKESGVVRTVEDLGSLYINKMILGSISFTKYINDKKGTLAGAEFELLINGERYGSTVFSDANGLVTFLDVKPGEYKIREVSSHSNYFKASDKLVDVVIDSNGVSSLAGEAKVEAETLFINKVENSIQFIKYGDNKSVLSNATFELLKGTEVIATSISDKNGSVKFDNILPGEYIVREKSAPNGYIKSDATRKLEVKDNGEISITASEIKEWEEAFKNKKIVEPKEEKPDKKEEIVTPNTSDNANIIFPLLTAMLSLVGIVLIKRVKH